MASDSFEVIGGHPLKGNISPQGAKNEALQILCAVLLTDQAVTISNIPDIVDVNKLIVIVGLTIIDETHHVCSKVFSKAVSDCSTSKVFSPL